MLAFARKQELKLEPTDILKSLHQMTALLQRTIGHGISIKTDYPLNLKTVLTDGAQLELAVMNLVVNARDAMPAGGDIIMSIREMEHPEDNKTFVRLSIEDQGEGMDPETLARATEPFYTTKGVGKGTGLGLSMVKGMVEQSGGRLLLKSRIGHGTTAEIWLPIAEQPIQPSKELTSSPLRNSKILRILVVDDDVIIMLNTSAMLTDMGHSVLEANSGRKALEILQNEEVDLLITDFSMPKMNGAELTEQAKRLKPDLKVIVASGYVDLPHRTTLKEHRLAKPYTEYDLACSIAEVCKLSDVSAC